MGGDPDLLAAIGHLVLCSISINGVSKYSRGTWVHPGMHVNFFCHGVLGFMKYQNLGQVEELYKISMAAAKYIGLPCLMADLYSSADMGEFGQLMMAVHLGSGVIPFVSVLLGSPNDELGRMFLIFNVLSCAYFSLTKERAYGWYEAAASFFTFFVAPTLQENVQSIFAIGLTFMDHFAYRVLASDNPFSGGGGGGRRTSRSH